MMAKVSIKRIIKSGLVFTLAVLLLFSGFPAVKEAQAAQFGRPDTDENNTGAYTPTPLWQQLDEVTTDDDTTVVDSGNNPAESDGAGFEVNLSSLTDPQSSTGHIVRVRGRRNGGARTITLNWRLYQGTTAITAAQSLGMTDTFQTSAYTLTAGEADSITDYTDLRIRVWGTTSGTGQGSKLRVTWAEMEVPDTAASTFTQNDFEWFIDEASVTLTDPWPLGGLNLAENEVFTQTPATKFPLKAGDKIRIQMNVTVGTANLSASGQAFQLEYVAAEDCTAASGWASVGAIGGGTIWRFFDNTSLTDGTTEVNQISTSAVAADYVESNPTQTNPNAVNSGQDMEWDFAVENNGAAENTTYCFRLAKSGGTALDTYNADSYPKLTTAPGARNLMRHGNFFQNALERAFFWAN